MTVIQILYPLMVVKFCGGETVRSVAKEYALMIELIIVFSKRRRYTFTLFFMYKRT